MLWHKLLHVSCLFAAEILLSSLVCSEEDEASNRDPTNAGPDPPEES